MRLSARGPKSRSSMICRSSLLIDAILGVSRSLPAPGLDRCLARARGRFGIGDDFGIVFHYARSPNRGSIRYMATRSAPLEQPLELLGMEP